MITVVATSVADLPRTGPDDGTWRTGPVNSPPTCSATVSLLQLLRLMQSLEMEWQEMERVRLLEEIEEARLEARYANANCRADVLERLQDCDTTCQPKPSAVSVIDQWPPAVFNDRSDPPALTALPEVSFTVETAPDMIKTCWAKFKRAANPFLSEPLTVREKTLFIEREPDRLSFVAKRAKWDSEYRQPCTLVDQSIYKGLFETIYDRNDFIPVPYDLSMTPMEYSPYCGRDFALSAVGRTGRTFEACMLRLLYVDDLDVVQEIQDIAASGVFVQSVEGRWVWPEALIATPRQRKARDFIQWVMHAARQTYTLKEGKCNRIKVSDGWNNIWFHFENGTLFVSPLLTPSRFDDAGATAAPIGVSHCFFSFAFLAGLELAPYIHDLNVAANAKAKVKTKESADVKVDLKETGSETAETVALLSLESPSPAVTNVGSVREEVAKPKRLNGLAKEPPRTQIPINIATIHEQKQLETLARKSPESETTPGIVGAAHNKAVEVKATKKPAGNSVYSQAPAHAVASVGSQQAGTPARKSSVNGRADAGRVKVVKPKASKKPEKQDQVFQTPARKTGQPLGSLDDSGSRGTKAGRMHNQAGPSTPPDDADASESFKTPTKGPTRKASRRLTTDKGSHNA